jgi:hypothetical protein
MQVFSEVEFQACKIGTPYVEAGMTSLAFSACLQGKISRSRQTSYISIRSISSQHYSNREHTWAIRGIGNKTVVCPKAIPGNITP